MAKLSIEKAMEADGTLSHVTATPPLSTEEKSDDSWLLPFADLITLLLVFFILLISLAKVDKQQYNKASSAIKSSLSKNESSQQQSNSALKEIASSLKETILIIEGNISISHHPLAVSIELKNKNFFHSAQATILPPIKPTLKLIAKTLLSLDQNDFIIEIHGHTDSNPIKTPQFYSNWELSSQRALSVLHFFTELGVPESMMRAISFGPTKPKVKVLSNDLAIQKKQHEKNRRVEIWIRKQVKN